MRPQVPALACPSCHRLNRAGATHCIHCKAALSSRSDPQSAEATVADWTAGSDPSYPGIATVMPAGTILADRYEIIELLGQGGMGVAYKAKDRDLDRIVALKVIRPELADQPRILH